jgi:hypothetical protein
MSSYLLLRNNKESGPFSFEEIKGMSLRPYDLIWVVEKSAAWRYPGEISEFKSFAPPVPEQSADLKRLNFIQQSPDTNTDKKTDSINLRNRENSTQITSPARSVYVNLPADRKTVFRASMSDLKVTDPGLSEIPDPIYEYANLYDKKPTRAQRYSGKILWVSTIFILFGAGILTGFFISDRRRFFSEDANFMQKPIPVHPEFTQVKKEISPGVVSGNQGLQTRDISLTRKDSILNQPALSAKRMITGSKKASYNRSSKKDSLTNPAPVLSAIRLSDSLKQNAISRNELLFQKVKTHPENYLNLLTGRYSTGVFGGISSFPVTVTNNSPVMMDLVVITIEYIQNNEKIFKTENLSFNDLESGETVTIKAPKSSRGIKITAHIHIVNSRQLDLSYTN